MMMTDDPPKERGRHRNKVENDMIRRRERDFRHNQMWSGAEDYYKRWDKNNTKFDSWTSPRYYEDNNKLISEVRNKRDKEELLEKRRDKLKRLLEEEHQSWDIELMVKRNLAKKNLGTEEVYSRSRTDHVPTDVLKDVNIGLKLQEEEKRKREAELKLYHQWRINNPIVRQYESKYRMKDLKLSWLDQQIEKRMEKEKEEKECKRVIKEQEERLKGEIEKEKRVKQDIEEKQVKLREMLDRQIEELKEKQKISEKLRRKETEDLRHATEIAELEEKAKEEDRRRKDRECALYNIKQHKLKLKQKAVDVQENLAREKEFILKMKRLELEELIEDEIKRKEIKNGLADFLNIVREQQELEKQRLRHVEFLFDSETRAVYEKQLEMWENEEAARKTLLKDVLDTVKKQIEENLEKNKERQRKVLKEREEMTIKIEEYDRELQALREDESKRKEKRRTMLDEDLKLKNARKKQQDNLKMKEIDDELERVRREEERLEKEIMRIQRKQGPARPTGRTRWLY